MRGCGISILGETENLTGHSPEGPAGSWPCFEQGLAWGEGEGLEQMVFRDPFQPKLFHDSAQAAGKIAPYKLPYSVFAEIQEFIKRSAPFGLNNDFTF